MSVLQTATNAYSHFLSMVSAARKRPEVLGSLLYFVFMQPCTVPSFQFHNSLQHVLFLFYALGTGSKMWVVLNV